MHDTVGQPGKDVEDGMLVGGENVGQVCAVKDVFQGRQDANPDVRSILVGNEAFGG